MTHYSSKLKYGVTDLGQATALVCTGHQVVDLLPNPNSDRVTFYFEPSNELDKTANAYWTGELTVGAKQYSQEMKNLKSRLYSLRRP